MPGDDAPPQHEDHNVNFSLAGQAKHTKFNKDDADIEDTLTLYVQCSLLVLLRGLQAPPT